MRSVINVECSVTLTTLNIDECHQHRVDSVTLATLNSDKCHQCRMDSMTLNEAYYVYFLKGGSSIATSPVLEESPDPTFIINYTHYYHICYDFHVCIIQIMYV